MKYQNVPSFEKHLASAAPHHFAHAYLVIIADDEERSSILHSLSYRLLSVDSPLEKFSSDCEMRSLLDALQSPSLFGGESVVLLDGCEGVKKKDGEVLLSFLEKAEFKGYLLLGSRGKTLLSKGVEKIGVVLDMSEEKPWEKEKRLALLVIQRAKEAGKWLSSDTALLLLERVSSDVAMLNSEVDKLICYVGERSTIERSDVFSICSTHSQATLWEMAEAIVWEEKKVFDESAFPALIFSLRSQLQIGLKMCALLEEQEPVEWSVYFPKMWKNTLEKRKTQAAKKGSLFFQKALDILFKIESLSRSGSHQTGAFLDFFFLSVYARR